MFGLFFNCQNETVNSVDQQSETLEYNSTLFNLISTIALDEDINCLDFEYPLTVSIYDADFQLTDIVTINNDDALYLFLQTLDTSNVASLNFPITIVLPDEQQIEVNYNQALQTSIILEGNSCNPLVSTFTNVTNPQTIYVRVEQYSNPDIYQIFTIDVTVEDCT